jgi:colanic acid biosynthesis glycosyl transferase WcaI
MRILIYGINYHPEPVGVGKYTGEMAEWLATSGHQVRVVTAPPHYPEWRVPEGYRALSYSRERFYSQDRVSVESPARFPSPADIEVFRCPIWVRGIPNGARRLLFLASFALSSFPVVLRQMFWRPDVVLIVEPTLFCSMQALIVARLSGAKAWLHIQDFEVDAAFGLGDLSSAALRTLAFTVERSLMRRFDRVSAISARMVERIISKGVDESRSVLFPNWVDTSAIYPMPNPNALRKELSLPDSGIIALYSGCMGKKQGLEVLAQASRRLANRPDIHFVFSGDGSHRNTFVEMTAKTGNVTFLPLQPADRLNDLLNMADIHLLPQRAGAADLMLPSKLTGMMASGRAIVATAASDTQLSAMLEDRGIVTPPGDVDSFVSAILRLADDGNLRQRLGEEARTYATTFLDSTGILSRFESAILETCGHSSPAMQKEPLLAGTSKQSSVDAFALTPRKAGDD